ncbi:antigen KI-67 [Schistosoma bovis]|nr:antigen KI-67 [Schistosoma bovis]
MRTPKPVQTPRISGVSELFVDEPDLVVESLTSIRTRRVVKIAKSSVDKSANSDCSILKKLPGKFTSQSTNEVTVQPSKTRSKTKRNVSTMDSQYPDSLSYRSMSVVKSPDKRMLKEFTEVVVPFPNNVMENHSRKGKTLAFTSRLTPNDTSNSCDQSALLKMGFIENSHPTVSFSSNMSKDRESDSVVPVASRLRNRRIPSSIECLSSSRTRRAVKAPDPLTNESATKGSSGKSSVMKTSSRKVVSQSNNEVAIQPSKTRSKTKKNVSTMDSQFPDPLLNHSVNATKSANNTSKRSIKRLAEVRRVSSSIPLAKRLRSRIDQLDIKCITSEHTQNEERSLPVKNQSGEEKKKNGTMTNNPRNRKQLITSKSKLLSTTSSSKSASTNESKNITTLKVNTNSRHIKRISVTPVDNIANVSPKRRVLRSRKLITTSSEISQPIEEKISTSKITNKSKLKTTTTTTTNNNNNRSVVSKSSQAKQSPVSIRQTRSRKKQTATNNL